MTLGPSGNSNKAANHRQTQRNTNFKRHPNYLLSGKSQEALTAEITTPKAGLLCLC